MIEINRDQRKDSYWKTLVLYGSLSLNLGSMIVGGFFLGQFLEERYQLRNMKMSGLLVGLLLGLYQMFAFAYRSVGKK